MAKKITIDIEVNGKMQKATVSAKKLNQALNETQKSTRTLDRNLKGAAGATANGTKAFSKMGQGMGGLVAVYASFAAQVFALTALFGALKNAADLENLRKSQVSFATSTGLAIQSLTGNLREASQGMLGFQEAAQAATIGVAKGFSGGQLEELVVGATKASAALGRNFDDTFDRLLRGVSKAEPELLDELGITLRLEEATNRYAEAIGTTRQNLTTAQRSQAVFVETMRQLNDTFGQQEAQTNPFVQLAKTFEDISHQVIQKVLPPITSLVNLINKNAKVAATAFGALAVLVISNLAGVSTGIGIVFGKIAGFAKGALSITTGVTGFIGKKTGGFISSAAQKLSDEIEFAELLLEEAVENTTSKLAGGAEKALAGGATSKTLEKIKKGELISPQALGRLEKDLKRVQKEIEETGETSSKAFAGMTVDAIKDMRKELKHFRNNTVSYGTKAKKVFGKIVVGAIKAVRKTAEGATWAVRKLAAAGQFAAKHFDKLKKAVRFGGFLITGILVIAKAVDKLAESPIRVIDGFKKMVSNTVKLVGKLFNFIIAGLNKLLDNSLVNSVFDGGLKIGEINTSGIDSYLDRLEDKVLTRLGTSRQELQVVQDTNDARKEAIKIEEDRLEKVKGIVEEYKTLFSDFKNILIGFDSTNIVNVARSISTLNLGGAIQGLANLRKQEAEAISGIDDPRLQSKEDKIAQIYRALNIGTMANELTTELTGLVAESSTGLPPAFAKAIKDALDNPQSQEAIRKVLAQQAAAAALVADEAALQDSLTNLRATIGTGDPLEQEIGLKRINNLIKAINTSIRTLYGQDSVTINKNKLSREVLGEDPDVLATQLEKIRIELDKVAIAKKRLGIDKVLEGAELSTSGTREQSSRQRAEEQAKLDLREKVALRQQLNLLHVEEDALSQANHQKRVAEAELEIRLAEAQLQATQRNLRFTDRLASGVAQSFETGMASAFDSVIQGTKNLKEAFLSMTQSVLQMISQMIARLIAMKIVEMTLNSFMFAGGAAKTTSIDAGMGGMGAQGNMPGYQGLGGAGNRIARYGGMYDASGKSMSGFATGGIAKGPQSGYPVMMHGAEAIVPLPNGKSIPVDINGAGQNNNVTVNVAIDGQGNAQQDKQADSNNGANLGAAIASVVQKELLNQKRAGGILNPMGA